MTQATLVWSIWKDLLGSFKGAFHKRGFPRFAEWITALAINVLLFILSFAIFLGLLNSARRAGSLISGGE